MRRLNFGAGGNRPPDFESFDRDVDVEKPLPFSDACADFILAEHLGEHLSGPSLLLFLKECYRILAPNGTMRLCCPIIGPWLKRSHAIDLCLNHGHLLVFNENTMRDFLWMAGFDVDQIYRTDRKPCDGHAAAIGEEKDAMETCRMEARKI
jgi:SAM-dependent methyltransferase